MFLADADLDDNGIVDAADAAIASACQGVQVPDPQVVIDDFLCPMVLDPDPSGCAAADVDRTGLRRVRDDHQRSGVAQRRGLSRARRQDR